MSDSGNLYPCCKECNNLLSDLIFNSIEEKRAYVRSKRIYRGSWDQLPLLREADTKSTQGENILLETMQVGSMGQTTSPFGSACPCCGSMLRVEGEAIVIAYIPGETCFRCGKAFSAKRPWQRYCSKKCRSTYHSERILEGLKILRWNRDNPRQKKVRDPSVSCETIPL